MPRPIQPGERHTYNEWQALGYQVQRGEHHVARSDTGAALFDATQVRPRNTAPPNRNEFVPRVRRTRAPRESPTMELTESTLERVIRDVNRMQQERSESDFYRQWRQEQLQNIQRTPTTTSRYEFFQSTTASPVERRVYHVDYDAAFPSEYDPFVARRSEAYRQANAEQLQAATQVRLLEQQLHTLQQRVYVPPELRGPVVGLKLLQIAENYIKEKQ